MAIDLCNKLESVSVPLDLLSSDQRADLGLGYDLDSPRRHVVGDPAAWASDFAHALDRVAIRLDTRSSEELWKAARTHADPVMREQALYEYADRNEANAIDLLSEAVAYDKDRQVRWAALWAIEKLGGLPAIAALEAFLEDRDLEVAEWARLFISELQTGDPAFDQRTAKYTEGRTFDETIFLLIHCDLYIRLEGSNQHWGKLSLAPQGLARVYGQAHACPNVDTREHTLIIAKTIEDLHADGTPHVDNYLFRGFTERTQADRGNFFFESQVDRPFFHSGRADDPSEGVHTGQIGFMRQGCWYLDKRFKIRGHDAIRYVRGSFQGWGYVNLDRVLGLPLEEVLVPGNGVLSTLHDDRSRPLTNAFIAGTFKGKLNDWDNDGVIDLNSRDVYATVKGEIDTNMDGTPDEPGRTCCDYRQHTPLP
ncbi:MAG TPA: HEAT repeat domain-containing protein [Rhodothermales bacterium]|nr:HEAT repeat domain-containing protein [Rhodothermales bacterium]